MTLVACDSGDTRLADAQDSGRFTALTASCSGGGKAIHTNTQRVPV